VAHIVLLDSGPLGLACVPIGSSAKAKEWKAWLDALYEADAEVIIPAIAGVRHR
jgi:hypothetical protein